MPIDQVEIRQVSVPLATPYREAIAEVEAFHHVITVIEADGERGIGEADFLNVTPNAAPIVAHALRVAAPRLVGRELDDVAGVLATVREVLGDALAPTAVAGGLAAIDLALFDALARRQGRPVHALLGGPRTDVIPVSFTLSAADAGEMAEAARTRVAQGYRTVVVKAGRGGPELDAARVAEVRAAVGDDVRIRVDVNGGYRDVDAAVAAIRGFEPYDVEFVEQPLPPGDPAELAALRRSVGVPLAADESLVTVADAEALARAGAVDIFNIKVTKCGGFQASLAVAAVAETAGIPCLVGGHPTQEIARQACRHFAAAVEVTNRGFAHEGPGPASQALVDQLTREVVTYDDVERLGGVVATPMAPGLGVRLREDVLARHTRGEVTRNPPGAA